MSQGTYIQYPQGGSGGSTGSQTGVSYVVGLLDGAQASPNGGVIGSFSLFLQSASVTNPGLVSSASQTFSGLKIFQSGINAGNNVIGSVSTPLAGDQATNKAYVDGLGAALTVGTIDGATASANGAVIGTSTLFMQTASAARPGLVTTSNQAFAGRKTFTTVAVGAGGANLPSLAFGTTDSTTGFHTVSTGALNIGVSIAGTDVANFYAGGLNLSNLSPSAPVLTAGSSTGFLSSGSISLTAHVTGNLPLSQTSGSISLTAQVSGILPVANGGSTGSNSGDISLAAFGSSPNSSGGSVGVGQVLTLQPADSSNPGGVSTGAQSFTGAKTFATSIISTAHIIGSVTHSQAAGGNTYTLNWPISQGSTSWVLQNNGSGTLSWANVITNPMTSSGDLVVGSGSGTAARLPIGLDGQILKADSTRPLGVGWAYATSSVTSVNANYTALKGDSLLTCSSFNYTITLYSAAAAAGSTLEIVNTGATVCSISIVTSSSQTINGSGTGVLLSTQWERYTFVSDGANWITDHNIQSNWTSVTLTTQGLGTLGSSSCFWKREEDELVMKGYGTVGAPGAATAALLLPFGLTIDYSKMPVLPSQAGLLGWTNNLTTSATPASLYSTDKSPVLFADGVSSQSAFFAFQGANSRYQKVNATTLWTATDGISFYIRVPVTGWRA